MTTELTDDIKTMLGNPRKALFAMAVPIAMANLLAFCNNLIDSVWLAGIGTGALAATGVVFPYYFLQIGIANGIGIGASQAIARRIGAKDYEGTHRVAAQAFVMILVAGVLTGAILLLLSEPLMEASGAGEYIGECLRYAFPLFLVSPFLMTGFVLSGMLRSEGAAKRSMYLNVTGAVLNIILDPIFIYGLGWGVAGAGWATAVAMSVSMIVGVYWYFVKKDTFVRIPLKGFRFDGVLDRDILRVGVPAAFEVAILGFTTLVMNQFALYVDPVNGVAVFGTGWRAVDLLIIPSMALGNAVVPIAAAAYGAKRLDKVKSVYMQSMGYGFAIMAVVSVLTFLAAPLIAMLFTYGEGTEGLAGGMIEFIRFSAVFMPFTALSYATFGFFQSMGMGTRSMVGTAATSVVRLPICAVIMVFSATFTALCLGITIAETVGAVLVFFWGLGILKAVGEKHAADGYQL